MATNVSLSDGMPHVDGKPIIYGVTGNPGKEQLSYFHANMPKRAILGIMLTMVEQLRLEAVIEGLLEARLVEKPMVQPVGTGVVGPDGMRLV
jgi:hypothetical protein